MNKIIHLILLTFFSISLTAQQTFTLEQAIQYGLQNSSKLKMEQLNLQDAEGQIAEYKAIGTPKINGSVDYRYYLAIPQFPLPDFTDPGSGRTQQVEFGVANNLTAGFELQALLFDGSFFVGLKAQSMYRDLVKKQAKVPEAEIKANVQKAFLAILIAKRNKEVLDRNLSNLENTLRESKAIFENGFAEKLDVDRLELSLNNLRVERGKVERLIGVSYNLLKFQMNYPLSEEIEIDGNLDALLATSGNIEEAVSTQLDFNLRPEYAAIDAGITLAGMRIRQLKAAYIPSIYGYAAYNQQLQRNDLFDKDDNPWFATSLVGATLNVPIFDGLDKRAKMQRARIEVDKSILQKIDFERGVTLEVENAKVVFLNANQTVETTKKSLEMAQNIYDVTQIKYKEGVGSSIEVTQAERELYSAQAANINALYELLVAKTDLDKALGKL